MKLRRWAVFAVLLLATHFSLMCWAVVLCTRQGGVAVIPNYYERAVHFDQIKAARMHAGTTTQPTSDGDFAP